MHSPCLFCGGDRSAPDHAARCDGRQGAIEAAIPDFDGETYERERDRERLRAQLTRVYGVMRDHAWRTLADIAAATNDPEASVSARLRDLRKDKFGGWIVERRYVALGQWEYRMLAPETVNQ